MLCSCWEGGSEGPIQLAPTGIKPELAFWTLPDDCKSLEGAKGLVDRMVAECSSHTLIHVTVTSASALGVEGFVIYTTGTRGRKITVTGYHTKIAAVKMATDVEFGIFGIGAQLVTVYPGTVPAGAPRKGWKYLAPDEVRDLLGHSLLHAAPRDLF
jgi:hypothetical protein